MKTTKDKIWCLAVECLICLCALVGGVYMLGALLHWAFGVLGVA